MPVTLFMDKEQNIYMILKSSCLVFGTFHFKCGIYWIDTLFTNNLFENLSSLKKEKWFLYTVSQASFSQ
jgi:hypothetical protein